MAAWTHAVTTPSSLNTNSYASGAFTPAASDLLVVMVMASDTVASATLTDSQSLGFTPITSSTRGANTVYLFAANALAAASSMTVTFDCTGDNATGCVIQVAQCSGMTLTGASAVRQSHQLNAAGGTTPEIVFPSAPLSANPLIVGMLNSTNPAGVSPPSGWAEQSDTGYATPGTGSEYATLDSGSTANAVAWGSVSASAWATVGAELDASAPVGQSARPDAELVAGTWTPSVALAPLHEMLDETTASDADYITSGATPVHDTAQVGLSPLTTPGEGIVTLRVRARLE